MDSNVEFIWLKPRAKSRLAVNIPNESNFNINPALLAELPERFAIGYNAEKMMLAIRPDDGGFVLSKGGKIRLPEMIRELVAGGMIFPARFSVERSGDGWIGTLEPQKKPVADLKKIPRRRKKPDLDSLAKEAAKL